MHVTTIDWNARIGYPTVSGGANYYQRANWIVDSKGVVNRPRDKYHYTLGKDKPNYPVPALWRPEWYGVCYCNVWKAVRDKRSLGQSS